MTKRVFSVPFSVDENQLKTLNSLSSHYQVNCENRYKHMHPMLHCERLIAEAVALELCGDVQILDIGGCPRRHFKYDRPNVFSCCPILSAADVHRVDKNLSLGQPYGGVPTQLCNVTVLMLELILVSIPYIIYL
jgi:hypothetical protein